MKDVGSIAHLYSQNFTFDKSADSNFCLFHHFLPGWAYQMLFFRVERRHRDYSFSGSTSALKKLSIWSQQLEETGYHLA